MLSHYSLAPVNPIQGFHYPTAVGLCHVVQIMKNKNVEAWITPSPYISHLSPRLQVGLSASHCSLSAISMTGSLVQSFNQKA